MKVLTLHTPETRETSAGLAPAVKSGGSVTAGNSSPLNDAVMVGCPGMRFRSPQDVHQPVTPPQLRTVSD